MSSSEAAKGRLPRYSFIVFELKNAAETDTPYQPRGSKLADLFTIARID